MIKLTSLHRSKLYISYSQTVRREGDIANQCRTGRYATLSLSSNFSSPLIADTLYWYFFCCWWEDDSGLSRDWYLLLHWYSRTPTMAPTTNAMVPVTTAIPAATPMLIVCIIPDDGKNRHSMETLHGFHTQVHQSAELILVNWTEDWAYNECVGLDCWTPKLLISMASSGWDKKCYFDFIMLQCHGIINRHPKWPTVCGLGP